MLTQREDEFLTYWKNNREKLSTTGGKLKKGFPFALLFSFPILAFLSVIFLFFPDWAAKISFISTGMIVMIFIAVALLTIFVAYFRMHFQWEMNEQAYKELIAKRSRGEEAAVEDKNHSD